VATVVVLLLAIAVAILLPPTRYLGPWQDIADQVIFYKEGVETTVAVFKESPANPKFSSVNGQVEVPTDVLSLCAFYLLGHLPALLRPDAQTALMLSFGNGIATGSLATLWYTGGTHSLLLATPEKMTRAGLEELLRRVEDNPTAQKDLGRPDQIPRYWIMDSGRLRQFASNGRLVYDDNAFFLPINAETQQLVQVIQLTAIRANR
jgi:hypothetical protein